MLPSTGYFKGISCPFYDNSLCERPYCHFRHVKKEYQNQSKDSGQSGAILQKIVSAAVQKVLQQTDSSVLSEATLIDISNESNKNNLQTSKATYYPTPISELNKINHNENNEEFIEQKKRHIPVPYTPRKPASLPIKRTIDTNGSSTPLIYLTPPVKYTPGASAEPQQLDPYTPKGGEGDYEGKYLPGSEIERQEYQPDETQNITSKHNYLPSDKSVNKKKILEYKPTKVSAANEIASVTYQPTPRALVPCFSSDEDEPSNKKPKLASDLNELDDLGTEFDMLSQILDEEKPVDSTIQAKINVLNDNSKNSKEIISSDTSIKDSIKEKAHNVHVRKKEKYKKDRSDSSKREKCKTKDDKNSDSKNKDHGKYNSKTKDKKSCDKRKHSSSKSSHENSKSSKDKSSKSEMDSNHKKRSKSNSKDRSKSERKGKHKSSREHKDKSKSRKSKSRERRVNNVSDNDFIGNESNMEDLGVFSESDEETRTEECKKIFEEYVPTEKCILTEENVPKIEIDNEEYVPTKKRISRTAEKNIKVVPKAPIKPDFKLNAAQAMANRLAKVKEFHSSQSLHESSNDNNLLRNIHNTSHASTTKIRIAHVPYASTLMNAKKAVLPNVHQTKPISSTSTTISQTVRKGEHRVAHLPNEKFIDRPGVLEPLASKIPANIRSTYLNMMIDECLKIYLATTDAYARAQHEELSTSKKCSTVQIYKNSAVLTVSRLRKEIQECKGVKKSGSECLTLQKIPVVSGNTSNTGSWSIENKNRRLADNSKEFCGAKLYSNIKKWILSEEQLHENGFPRPHPSGDKGRAIIYGQKKQIPPKGYVRTCCRCKKDYTVDKKGFASVKEECIYHPNNKYRVRGEARYQCCSQDSTSDGCCIAPSHVYEYVDYENLKGYIKTMPPEREMENYGVYSLDCEMCYTTHGLDLTRVTVINSDCKVIYESLIKPLHPIVDYNTRYSGITEEQMKGVRTSLLEVQATLLAMFNSKTILIGHSLESDFKALKLIHDTVIDTSVLFPHKMGPPYKRALRNLSSEYLKKIIQNSVDGHDSAEDATVCMELILYKLKDDLKTR